VRNKAFNGHLESNPFNFKHCLSEIAVYLDGQQQFALQPIQPDCENGLYIRAYETIYWHWKAVVQGRGTLHNSRRLQGRICVVRVRPDSGFGRGRSFQSGETGQRASGSEICRGTSGNCKCGLAYVEFENVREVDRDGNVVFDFGI